MKKYAKVINEETKICEVGLGTNSAFYQSIGMTEMEVEQAYDGNWYLQGFAPEKPAKEIAQEKIEELQAELAKSDYIDNKFIEAIVKNDSELLEALKVKYKDKLDERQAIRNRIDELEEIINDTI
jgi:outer membrane translocation and assembly module TamA